MKKYIAVFFIIFVFGCAAVKLVTPSQTDADRGSQKFQGYTFTELNEGKQIYEAHCNKCHRYKAPQTRDETKWVKIIPKMAKKAKLDSLEESLVLKYVVTMSPIKPN